MIYQEKWQLLETHNENEFYVNRSGITFLGHFFRVLMPWGLKLADFAWVLANFEIFMTGSKNKIKQYGCDMRMILSWID